MKKETKPNELHSGDPLGNPDDLISHLSVALVEC